jgi:hypothetical protein
MPLRTNNTSNNPTRRMRSTTHTVRSRWKTVCMAYLLRVRRHRQTRLIVESGSGNKALTRIHQDATSAPPHSTKRSPAHRRESHLLLTTKSSRNPQKCQQEQGSSIRAASPVRDDMDRSCSLDRGRTCRMLPANRAEGTPHVTPDKSVTPPRRTSTPRTRLSKL